MVVFGRGALARALATHWAHDHTVTLASREPRVPGPWLWRRIDPVTGEGVKAATAGHRTALVCIDGPVEGLLLVLRPASDLRGVLARPVGLRAPDGFEPTRWAHLLHEQVVAAGDPVWDTWARFAPSKLIPVPWARAPLRVTTATDAVDVAQGLIERLGTALAPAHASTWWDLAAEAYPMVRRVPIPPPFAGWLGLRVSPAASA